MTYSEKALESLKQGKMNDFNNDVKQALEHDDDDMLYSLAEELYSLGFLDDSARIYKTLLKKYPGEDELRTDLADILISEDKTDQALEYLNEIKPNSPNYVNALLVEADLYQTQKLPEVSEKKLLEARKIDPGEDVIDFALAELYFSTGEYKKAIPLYLELIKKGITSLSSVNLVERLGVSYAHIGHFKQAIGYLKQIKLINMSSNVKFETGFTYLQLEDYPNAIEVFSQLIEDDPQYASVYLYLGVAYADSGEDKKALEAFQEGMSVDEYNVALYDKASEMALRLNKDDLALKYLKKGHEVDPEDSEIILKLSNLLVALGKYQDDVDFLKPLAKEGDLDPQCYWNLAVSYQHLENYQSAERAFEHAEPFFKNSASFLKDEIIFLHEIGKNEKAKGLLEVYLKKVPDDLEMEDLLTNM